MTKLELNLEDIYSERAKMMVEDMIRLLRLKEYEYLEGKSHVGGKHLLFEMVKDGTIKISTALQVLETLDNLSTPFEVIIKK